jgi:hypothetical protein
MERTPLSTGCCRPRNDRQPPARLRARVTPRSGEPLLCTLAASERPRSGVISGPFAPSRKRISPRRSTNRRCIRPSAVMLVGGETRWCVGRSSKGGAAAATQPRDRTCLVSADVRAAVATAVATLEQHGPVVTEALRQLDHANTAAWNAVRSAEPTDGEWRLVQRATGISRGWQAAYRLASTLDPPGRGRRADQRRRVDAFQRRGLGIRRAFPKRSASARWPPRSSATVSLPSRARKD